MSLLPPRQEAFAAGVAQGLSQAEAYRRAYPRAVKWKDETVWSRASELMKTRKVLGRVEELMGAAAASHEVTQGRIVQELARIAFGDRRALMRWGADGVLLVDSDALSDDEAAMVAEVQATMGEPGGAVRVKTYDKVKALELLGRHVGMFNDNVRLTGPGGLPLGLRVTIVGAGKDA